MTRRTQLAVLLLVLMEVIRLPMATAVATGPCPTGTLNVIAGICWNCFFPISIGPVRASFGQPDSGDTAPIVCSCPAPPPLFVRIGTGMGFWEPARMAEVVRSPYCSPTLGGVTLASLGAPSGTHGPAQGSTGDMGFYHVHWFVYPLLSWLGMAFTTGACASEETFDMTYLTELDPLWDDDELSLLINPEAALFANPIAQAACAADSVAAVAGFGLDPLFWCSGSQGSVYPLAGTSDTHIGMVDTTQLLMHRMAFKLHRQLVALDTSTSGAMCGAQPQPIMRKGQYKSQMVFPVPQTTTGIPFGRPSILWGVGREFPYAGEDAAYLIWRKRLCCAF